MGERIAGKSNPKDLSMEGGSFGFSFEIIFHNNINPFARFNCGSFTKDPQGVNEPGGP